MCLTVNSEALTTRQFIKNYAKKAVTDIIVYKKLDKTGLSPYRGFQYNIGYHYYNEGKYIHNRFNITKALYSNHYYINKGLHACRTLEDAKSRFVGSHIYQAIIPKGSTYFVGIRGDIVSDNLIIVKKLKIK